MVENRAKRAFGSSVKNKVISVYCWIRGRIYDRAVGYAALPFASLAPWLVASRRLSLFPTPVVSTMLNPAALSLVGGLFASVLLPVVMTAAPRPSIPVMPRPATVEVTEGRLPLGSDFRVAVVGHDDARLRGALDRAVQRLGRRIDSCIQVYAPGGATPADVAAATLRIECGAAAREVPQLGDDESYTLEITAEHAALRAPNTIGVTRGLETLLQLAQSDAQGWFLPASVVRDAPRFAWRGLLIDVARHWQPADVIRRELDGMALVKLNVLHLHLTDDQGFRIESRTHPELHTKASDGHFFTQAEMRELIRYAADRGIRVVPEFDVPGHATSWCVSHPELASAPGPYEICRRWGIEHPVLDPTNEALYPLLDDFFGEMAALFPDAFMHIGGDENDGVHWTANARIQEFIRTHNLRDNPGLHAWFNGRLTAILQRHGKRLIGWDEVLHPDLPADSVVQSWRGPTGVVDAARAGHAVLLSNGYYIDLNHPAADHYVNDPLPADSPLTPAQQKLVLGGEATMWSEWVTPDNIDSRIWPRTAAVAERLWSPREVSDVADMYRRLSLVEAQLREIGLLAGWPRVTLPGIDPHGPVATALLTLASVVEPVKVYERVSLQADIGQLQPLNELADLALPESRPAREFAAALERWLAAAPRSAADAEKLTAQLRAWRAAGELAATAPADATPRAQGRVQAARSLVALAQAGDDAITALLAGKPLSPERTASIAQAFAEARPTAAAVEFPFLPALRKLAVAAADPAAREKLSRTE